MPTPSLHAMLGASSSDRWLHCPPSARLNERLDKQFGRKGSTFAEEGTRAHALGEAKIRNALYHADEMTTAKLSRMTPEEREAYQGINDHRYEALRSEIADQMNGEIPKDMDQATDSYCDVVMHKLFTARQSDPSTILLLEQRYDYSAWVPGGFGTGDCTIVSDSLLEIMDYKHGKGVLVNAVGNPQIRLYALGAYAQYGMLYDFERVRGTIIQPRQDNLSEETLSVDELLNWAETEVVDRAKQAWAGEGEFAPGDWCRWCSAKAICSARVAKSLELFQYGLESPGVIPEDQIPKILDVIDVAESWIKNLREYAESRALQGKRWDGYKLVHGKRPNRAWRDPEEVKAQLLRSGYGPEQIMETKLKKPGEMEKALGKTAFRALLGGLVEQGEGRLTLVPESDSRKEYSTANIDFADMITNTQEENKNG